MHIMYSHSITGTEQNIWYWSKTSINKNPTEWAQVKTNHLSFFLSLSLFLMCADECHCDSHRKPAYAFGNQETWDSIFKCSQIDDFSTRHIVGSSKCHLLWRVDKNIPLFSSLKCAGMAYGTWTIQVPYERKRAHRLWQYSWIPVHMFELRVVQTLQCCSLNINDLLLSNVLWFHAVLLPQVNQDFQK